MLKKFGYCLVGLSLFIGGAFSSNHIRGLAHLIDAHYSKKEIKKPQELYDYVILFKADVQNLKRLKEDDYFSRWEGVYQQELYGIDINKKTNKIIIYKKVPQQIVLDFH